MNKIVYGNGINDLPYGFTNNKKGRKLYNTWKSMLERVFDEKFLEKRPSYKGVKISKEWLYASNFVEWMLEQNYEGKTLDKDILSNDGKLYSKDTCCFVHKYINSLFVRQDRNSEKLSGVTKLGDYRYKSSIQINGRTFHLGVFDNKIDANIAFLIKKKEVIINNIKFQDDERIAEGMLKRAEDLSCTI